MQIINSEDDLLKALQSSNKDLDDISSYLRLYKRKLEDCKKQLQEIINFIESQKTSNEQYYKDIREEKIFIPEYDGVKYADFITNINGTLAKGHIKRVFQVLEHDLKTFRNTI